MRGITATRLHDRGQHLALAILFLGAVGFTGILSLSQGQWFQPYFGNLHPLLVVTVTGVLGSLSLRFLFSHGGFEIFTGRDSLKGMAFAAIFAALFAVVIILVEPALSCLTSTFLRPIRYCFTPPWPMSRRSCFMPFLFRFS